MPSAFETWDFTFKDCYKFSSIVVLQNVLLVHKEN